jgi:hypothetical protein
MDNISALTADGGQVLIILQALVTPSEVMENQPMSDLSWRTYFHWKIWPVQVTGDTTYGTIEGIVALEEANIHAYVPLPDFDERTPFYGRGEFTYDAVGDVYVCPQGEALSLRKHKYTKREKVYQAPAGTCNACSKKGECTQSDQGRQVRRGFEEACLQEGASLS